MVDTASTAASADARRCANGRCAGRCDAPAPLLTACGSPPYAAAALEANLQGVLSAYGVDRGHAGPWGAWTAQIAPAECLFSPPGCRQQQPGIPAAAKRSYCSSSWLLRPQQPDRAGQLAKGVQAPRARWQQGLADSRRRTLTPWSRGDRAEALWALRRANGRRAVREVAAPGVLMLCVDLPRSPRQSPLLPLNMGTARAPRFVGLLVYSRKDGTVHAGTAQ